MHYTWNIDPCPAPRMVQSDKWNKRPCVMKYFAYRDFFRKIAAIQQYKLTPVIDIEFIFEMPKSWSVKKMNAFDNTAHQSRPDIDNLLKAVLDSLSIEDSFVYKVSALKKWGRKGKVIIFKNNPLLPIIE